MKLALVDESVPETEGSENLSRQNGDLSKTVFEGMKPSVYSTKREQILGYSETSLKRGKALKVLGVTEDELELENSKNSSTVMKKGARRRSSGSPLRPATVLSLSEMAEYKNVGKDFFSPTLGNSDSKENTASRQPPRRGSMVSSFMVRKPNNTQ